MLWHPSTNRFLNSKHVKFNEKITYKSLKELKERKEQREKSSSKEKEKTAETHINTETESENPNLNDNEPTKEKKLETTKRKSKERNEEKTEIRKQPKRTAKTNHKTVTVSTAKLDPYNENHLKRDEIFANLAQILGDPKNYKEILERDDKDAWIIATNNELKSMIVNDVWDIVDRPTVDKKGN